jgi:hypothetical protein
LFQFFPVFPILPKDEIEKGQNRYYYNGDHNGIHFDHNAAGIELAPVLKIAFSCLQKIN